MRPTEHRAASLLHRIAGAWKRWREREAAAAELAACGAAEIDRIASDLRLTDGELRKLADCGPDSARLLDCRLAADNIAPATIDGPVMRDMQRCCSTCDSKSECTQDLKQEAKPETQEAPQSAKWPSYCPNAETLAALASSRCH